MLKVFLVEDESVIREGLRDKIPWEQYGFRLVGEAGDGEMALPLIRKTRPNAVSYTHLDVYKRQVQL